jgi:membrane protein
MVTTTKPQGRLAAWKAAAGDLVRAILAHNLLDYAGSVAFSSILAIFPFLLFAVALAGLVIDPRTLDTLVAQIHRVAPAAVADILTDRLSALTTGTRPGLLTLGAVLAIWAASSAVAALGTALNVVWGVSESRPFWKTRGIAALVTVLGAMGFVAVSALAFAAPWIAGEVGPLGQVVLWLRWPVAALLVLAIVAALYRVLPDVDQPFRLISPGSASTVVAWAIASEGFSLYVSHFGNYDVVYGSLGGAIVLLLWMWISALVILVGAEIDALWTRLRGRPTPGR